MLFHSIEFLFVFLPATMAGYYLLGLAGASRHRVNWLIGASFVFYGWWKPAYLPIILSSIAINFLIGKKFRSQQISSNGKKKWLISGLVFNLGLLGYYKYAHFTWESLSTVLALPPLQGHIELPLAISFFTFQQVAYLVDTYRNQGRQSELNAYALFVTFFPQLIAGPIVHHKDVIPQFRKLGNFTASNLAVGFSVFFFGMIKKAVIADNMARLVGPIFTTATSGETVLFLDSWISVLAYTLQIYFDFSGYSDMAIGLGLIFGIAIPINFNSPYKSTNIIDFWRTWHITLSTFLRDYLYIPLGGNKKGPVRRYVNLLLTMVLGGLWHGAGWTFVFWGTLHGCYLMINHAVRGICSRVSGLSSFFESTIGRCFGHITTLVGVMIAWVFFRAESFSTAVEILGAMAGENGFGLDTSLSINTRWELIKIATLFGVVFWLPNTQEIFRTYLSAASLPSKPNKMTQLQSYFFQKIQWSPTFLWALLISGGVSLCVINNFVGELSEFLYFQF